MVSVVLKATVAQDYTNPNLPVAPSAIDGTGQFSIGPDGQRREPESNVLLASIENMLYAVTVDVLHTVFSAFGTVQKIAMFEKNAGTQALIQYAAPMPWFNTLMLSIKPSVIYNATLPGISLKGCNVKENHLVEVYKYDVPTAVIAKEALEGHCIYDGGYCKLHLSYSRHTDLNVKVNNDRSRDYTIPKSGILQNQPSVLGQQPSALPPGVGGNSPSSPFMYSGNQLGSGVHPPPPAGMAGSRPMQRWEYDQPHAVSQAAGSTFQGSMPNQMYMNSSASPAAPLGATSLGFPGQGPLSIPPYSSPQSLPGLPSMQNPGPQASHMGPGMSPLSGQSPYAGPAFSMPAYSHQPMHMQTPGGGPPSSGTSGYYM
eukprot:Gb_07421 [translate_table: standard]